jgi:hypothetical protein
MAHRPDSPSATSPIRPTGAYLHRARPLLAVGAPSSVAPRVDRPPYARAVGPPTLLLSITSCQTHAPFSFPSLLQLESRSKCPLSKLLLQRGS